MGLELKGRWELPTRNPPFHSAGVYKSLLAPLKCLFHGRGYAREFGFTNKAMGGTILAPTLCGHLALCNSASWHLAPHSTTDRPTFVAPRSSSLPATFGTLDSPILADSAPLALIPSDYRRYAPNIAPLFNPGLTVLTTRVNSPHRLTDAILGG